MSDPHVGAIILAGGRSTRLGRDKASAPLLGRPLIQHVMDRVTAIAHEVVVVRATGQQLPSMECPEPLRIVDDAYEAAGPLAGLYTGLNDSNCDRAIAVACDMPLLSEALLLELAQRSAGGCDVVMPMLDRPQPLHAVYARSCAVSIRARLEVGERRLTSFLGDVSVCYVDEQACRRIDPELRSFLNTNTEEDLREAAMILALRAEAR
jgi:molybdopterin-guanine dinucleotide biosynthesis protein A